MNTIAPSQQVYPIKALVFTSVVTGIFLTVFALITLYGPGIAQTREEVVLIDLGLTNVPQDGNSVKTQPEKKTTVASLQTGASQQQVKANGHEQLPVNDKEALFPGMYNQEEGTGKTGGKEPGTGTDETTNVPGTYGINTDLDYQLGGRNCLYRPVMSRDIDEEGKIVVNIMVNEEGAVTRASVNEQQTNTNSVALRKIALNSALKTKWTEKKGIPEQKGHIVYKFVLK